MPIVPKWTRKLLLQARRHGILIDEHEGFSPEDGQIIKDVFPEYTMTSPERLIVLLDAVRYVVRAAVVGAIVECGVWRGGSMRAAARCLLAHSTDDRDLFLFDTYEGMPPAGLFDTTLRRMRGVGQSVGWLSAPMEGVRKAVGDTGYPQTRTHFIKGLVQDTIPEHAPHSIALLRLDTDYYDSTRHELTHLYPRVSSRGVVIIDDYGYWRGAREAADEYFGQLSAPPLLVRVDYTARLIVKP